MGLLDGTTSVFPVPLQAPQHSVGIGYFKHRLKPSRLPHVYIYIYTYKYVCICICISYVHMALTSCRVRDSNQSLQEMLGIVTMFCMAVKSAQGVLCLSLSLSVSISHVLPLSASLTPPALSSGKQRTVTSKGYLEASEFLILGMGLHAMDNNYLACGCQVGGCLLSAVLWHHSRGSDVTEELQATVSLPFCLVLL